MKKILLVLTMIAASVFLAQPAIAAEGDAADTSVSTASGDPAPSADDAAPAPTEKTDDAPPPADPPAEQSPAADDSTSAEPAPIAHETDDGPAAPPADRADDTTAAKPAPADRKDADPTTNAVAAAAVAPKVWVCKYVGTPGTDERLKEGKNPIFVSANTLPGDPANPQVGDTFPDAQGRSIVVQVGGADPGVSACPAGDAATQVTTEEPLLIAPTCVADGFIDLPTTPGVLYTLLPSNTPGAVTVDATAVNGYVLSAASTIHWSFVIEAQLSGPVLCPVVVVPAPDSVDVKICHATASFTNPYNVIPPATAGVANGHDTQHDGPIFNGVDPGWGDIIEPYVYQGVSYPGQNWTAEGQAFFAAGCTIPAPVVPLAPTVANGCGQDGHVTLPADTTSIHYAFTTGDGITGSWVVTATAQPGYYFANGVDNTSDGTVVTPGPCVVNQQAVPAISLATTCDGGQRPTPVVVTGVSYQFTVGDGLVGPWTITATAAPGFNFGPGTQFVFSGDAGSGTTCATVVPPTQEVKPVSADGVVSDAAKEDDLLPNTGGVPLWMLLLGGPMTAAGLLIVMRRRPVDQVLAGGGGTATYALTMPPRHLVTPTVVNVAPSSLFARVVTALRSILRTRR